MTALQTENIDTLAESLSGYLARQHINQVRRAYYYAEQAHEGQLRRTGDPYITHPLQVAGILSKMHMDHQSLMAAMLHDVIEDTGITKTAIKSQFGNTVAEMVDGVSKLSQIKFRSQAEAQAENFQKMALAMSRDLRIIMVKLADRLHNMRTIKVLPPDKRRRIARETLEIYAPIANRLGMNDMRIEFEELSFEAIYPLRYPASAPRCARCGAIGRKSSPNSRHPWKPASNAKDCRAGPSAGRSICTAFTTRCAASGSRFPRSWTSTLSASSSTG